MEQYYKIDGLDCANCAMKLEKNIRKLEGIHTCEIDFIQKSTVSYTHLTLPTKRIV